MHDHTAAIRPKRFVEELKWVWNKDVRVLYRRLTRTYKREFIKLLDATIEFFVSRFTNARRMLKEQLGADGVRVYVSAGCLAELARIASEAAARTRHADESYGACLRREIVAPSRFIRDWTGSDKKFDQAQWGALVAIARKYALPRPWKLSEAVASVRGRTVAAQLATQAVPERSDG